MVLATNTIADLIVTARLLGMANYIAAQISMINQKNYEFIRNSYISFTAFIKYKIIKN